MTQTVTQGIGASAPTAANRLSPELCTCRVPPLALHKTREMKERETFLRAEDAIGSLNELTRSF